MKYLLMCRSLTYAQRSARLLERAGITATVWRVPRTASDNGCGWCVIVSPRHRDRATEILTGAGLRPVRVLRRAEDGTVTEEREEA